MIIRNIMVMMGAVILVFSFRGTVSSQNLDLKQPPLKEFAKGKGLLILAQNSDQFERDRKRKSLMVAKENTENQIEIAENHIKEREERLINYLEQARIDYDQWVRTNGISDVSETKLNIMNDRKEREQLEINQQKRRLVTLYEELKKIQTKLEENKMP